MRVRQYSKKQPCYYCGAPPPSSREHAPPMMMFAGFDCDSITVPSCDKHNTKKGVGDRAVITAVIMSASQMLKNLDKLNVQLTANVITAITLAEPDFHQAKNEVELRQLLIDPPEGLDIPLPYTQPGTNIHGWIKQLTAALVWSVTGRYEPNIQWDEALAWSPGYLATEEPIMSEKAVSLLRDYRDVEQQFEELPWRFGWSAAPTKYPVDIYSFDLCFLENPERWQNMNIVFRHRFYNSTSVWYLLFKAPQEITSALLAATDSE